MTIGGGEAADQMVRMMLSGGEVAVRLGGSALKNLLALTMALAQNRKALSGKVNMERMLRETRDLRLFPMSPEQYKQFQKHAKKQEILFSAIKDRDGRGRVIDVVMPVTELDRANLIFERILYQGPARQAPEREERAPSRPVRGRVEPSPDRDREPPLRTQEAPQESRPGQEQAAPQEPREGPQRPPSPGQVGPTAPAFSTAGRPVGDSAKKRFSVGTRLARYQNQLLYLQRERRDE